MHITVFISIFCLTKYAYNFKQYVSASLMQNSGFDEIIKI